jgi:hypothetical protein
VEGVVAWAGAVVWLSCCKLECPVWARSSSRGRQIDDGIYLVSDTFETTRVSYYLHILG